MLKSPDFIYVGVQRSGSSFLRGYFDGHPDIVWRREAFRYLMSDEQYGNENFKTQSDVPDGKVLIEVGEMLTMGLVLGRNNKWDEIYTKPGISFSGSGCAADPTEIAKRINETYPSAKIILTLRNQIDWFRTHYRNILGSLSLRQHRFSDYLSTLEGQLVLNEGFYDRIVQSYFDLFGRERVYIGLFEDIRDNEQTALRALRGFLGVREAPYDRQFLRYNRGPSNAEFMVRSWLASTGISVQKLARFRPLAQKLRDRLPAKMPGPDPLSTDNRRMIAALYALSNQRTARLIGRDLADAGYPW